MLQIMQLTETSDSSTSNLRVRYASSAHFHNFNTEEFCCFNVTLKEGAGMSGISGLNLCCIFSILIFQNLLGGALFGVWKAFPLCCFLTAVGATCCYLLSYAFGRTLVLKYFSNRVKPLENKVRTLLMGM